MISIVTLLCLFLKCLLEVRGNNLTTVIYLSPEGSSLEQNDKEEKKALRYGFQHFEKCNNFKMSYICVQKCLDLNFDVASMEKNCKCTCHKRSDKGKHTKPGGPTRHKWKSGAPTTSKPYWAQTKKKLNNEDVQSDTDSSNEIIIHTSNGTTDGNNTTHGNNTVAGGNATTGGNVTTGVNATTGGNATTDVHVTTGVNVTTDGNATEHHKLDGPTGNSTSSNNDISGGNVTAETAGEGVSTDKPAEAA